MQPLRIISHISLIIILLLGNSHLAAQAEGELSADCNQSVTPITVELDENNHSGEITVTTGADCEWSASTTAPWLRINQPLTPILGSGAVQYDVALNTSIAERSGTLTVAGQTVTINQAGVMCEYALSNTSVTALAEAGTGEVVLNTKSACPWTLMGGTDWLTTTSPAEGTGPVALTYHFTANPLTISRTGTFVLNDQILTITQAGVPTCPVTLDFNEVNHTYTATAGRLNVTTASDCNWSAQSLVSWLTVTAINSNAGAGNGSVDYSVAANETGAVRQGQVVIGDQTLTVIQTPEPLADCSLATLAIDSAQYSANSQMGSVLLSVPVNCDWTAQSDADWITLANSSTSGRGTHDIIYLVAGNASDSARVGSLTIAGLPFSVTQQARQCQAIVTPTAVQYTMAANQGHVNLAIGENCDWVATSDVGVDWLTVLNNSRSGRGASQVEYFIEQNTTGQARTTRLTVAGQIVNITQTAEIVCAASLTPIEQQHLATASNGVVSVTTSLGCTWEATSNDAWLTLTSSDPTTGQVSYRVSENPTTQPRTGTLTIAEQTFTVVQEGNTVSNTPDNPPGENPKDPPPDQDCVPNLALATVEHGAGQESGLVTMDLPIACSWRVTSSQPWVNTQISEVQSNAFAYTLMANAAGTPRSAELTVITDEGSDTLTVTQAAGQVRHTLTINLLPGLGNLVTVVDEQTSTLCDFTQCQFNYPAGTRLTLAAQSTEGWQFDEWLNCANTEALCVVDLNADIIVSAKFKEAFGGYALETSVIPEQAGHLEVNGRFLSQNDSGVANAKIQLEIASLADATFKLERDTETDEFGRYVFTDLTDFVPGETYNVLISAFDPQDNQIDSMNIVTFPTQAFTRLSLDLNSPTILNQGVISLAGKLTRFPAAEVDLSGIPLELTIIAPDGRVEVIPLETETDIGQYKLTDVDGFDQSGTYTLQTAFAGTTALGKAVSEPKILLVGSSAGYAMLVQGRIANGEGLEAHNKTVQRIYQRLKNRGFEEDNILYFNYDPSQSGVDGVPSKTAIQQGLTDLQTRMNTSPAPFYLIMINHGGVGGSFYIDDGNGARISPTELGQWMKTFELGLSDDAFTEYPRVIMLGACYSGSFIPELSGRGRIVITSSAADEVSFKGPQESDGIRSGEFFMEELFHRLERGNSLKQAFEFATTRTEIYTRRDGLTNPNSLRRFQDNAVQHPLLDDNGDSVGSNVLNIRQFGSRLQQDGSVHADSLYLGVGANFDTNFEGNPADILTVTETLFLAAETNKADLTMLVNDANRVDSATVDIRLPSTTLTLEQREYTEQLEIRDLPREFLSCDKSHRCTVTTQPVFQEPGQYEIFYFVRDTVTEAISPIKRSLVYKNHPDNRSPTGFSLLEPRHNATPQTVLLFDWNDSRDLDNDLLTYTLEIALDEEMSQVIYQQQELTQSASFIDAHTWVMTEEGTRQRGLQDQTEYFWRVSAVDIFGARTDSSVRRFVTDNPNAQPGIHTAYFDSLLPDIPLPTVDIAFAVEPLAESIAPDQHIAMLPEGTHEIHVNAPGFEPIQEKIAVTSGQVTESNIVLRPLTQISLTERILHLPAVAVSGLGGFRVTLQGNTDLSQLTLETAEPIRLGSQPVVAQFNNSSGRLLINSLAVLETEERYAVELQWLMNSDPMQFEVIDIERLD